MAHESLSCPPADHGALMGKWKRKAPSFLTTVLRVEVNGQLNATAVLI